MGTQIQDAYISIDLSVQQVASIQNMLRQALAAIGLESEGAAPEMHVSVAYTQGCVEIETVQQVLGEIAGEGFETRIQGVEILEGHTTPYDYVVLRLAATSQFNKAVGACSRSMNVKSFEGGFRSHVSLLRYPKGSIRHEGLETLAGYLGRCCARACSEIVLNGESVSVFDNQRERQLQIPLKKAA